MTDVENLRYELGKEMRAKGENLHEGASEEFQRGYTRPFGSNVTPRKFGAGNFKPQAWNCVCGEHNPGYRVQCQMCNLRRDYVLSLEEI